MLLSHKFNSVDHAVDACIGLHFGALKIQLLSPRQSCLDAQFYNLFKELLKYFQPISFPDFAQATMLHLTIEIVIKYQVFQGYGFMLLEFSSFVTKHVALLMLKIRCKIEIVRLKLYFCSILSPVTNYL